MRIGIEAQRLFRPHKHGMDRVVLELIRHLQILDKENEYFVFVKPDVDNQVIKNTDNFTIVEVPGGAYPIWEQLKLPKLAKAYQCDVLHCTSNTAPWSVKMPLITTLHDIIFKESSIVEQLISSASWYQKMGNLYRRWVVNRVVKRSDQLITVSNYEKQNITHSYSLNNNAITTVYNGVNSQFTAVFESTTVEAVKAKYQLPDQFLLHIGNTDPRKNTARVLEAFYQYIQETSEMMPLVLMGLNQAQLKTILKTTGLDNQLREYIVLTGYVADDDLPVIMHLSKLFLFPSLREGFGIPIIEAMACGVPVITSNTSSMPEVAGNAACLVVPTSTKSIFEAIIKIRTDSNYRATLVERGLERYKSFSWNHTAQKVLDIYQQFNNKNTNRL
jgi:glycosyltransferase involved in cell wall biosynthesis